MIKNNRFIKIIILTSSVFLTNCYKFHGSDFYCRNWGNIKESQLKQKDLDILNSHPKDLFYPKDKFVITSMTNHNVFDFHIKTFREYCSANKYPYPLWISQKKSEYNDRLVLLNKNLLLLKKDVKQRNKSTLDLKKSLKEKEKDYNKIKHKLESLEKEFTNISIQVKNIKNSFDVTSKICEVVYPHGSSYNTQSKTLVGFGLPLPRKNCTKRRVLLNGGAAIYVAGIEEKEVDLGVGPYKVFEMPRDIIDKYYVSPNYNGLYYIFYRNKELAINILFGKKAYKSYKRKVSHLENILERLKNKIEPLLKIRKKFLDEKNKLFIEEINITESLGKIKLYKEKIRETKHKISRFERFK
jgi:hypothetical protein